MPSNFVDLVGYAAGALVFLTFSMKTLMALRVVAIASNFAFIVYAYWANLAPILLLHGLLLPLNLWRTWEQYQLAQRIREALSSPPSADVLLPYMTMQYYDAGTVIFRRGDSADRLYYIVNGRIRIEEADRKLEEGALLGEIALFTADQKRTATAIAEEPTQLCWIGKEAVLGLYRQHPDFGLVLTKLVAERMADNQQQLQERLTKLESKKAAE